MVIQTPWKVMFGLALLNFAGCASDYGSVSLGYSTAQLLLQPQIEEVPTKIDVLFVIDNSGSMASSQQNLASNFPRFINKFLQKNYDFHLAITTTDAYKALTHGEKHRALFRRSSDNRWLLTRDTPNLTDVFYELSQPGTNGSGDERAFLSFRVALELKENEGFLRNDAFLAIIIVSDEDDFSHTGQQHLENAYLDKRLWAIEDIVNYLTQLKSHHPTPQEAFMVSAVTITDNQCLNRLKINAQKIGKRYMELAQATKGQIVSLCDNFGDNLELIADRIQKRVPVEARLTLSKKPRIETIEVFLNQEKLLPQIHWRYQDSENAIYLVGEAATNAQEGGVIQVKFIPINPFE